MEELLTSEELSKRWKVPANRIGERIAKGASMPASIKIGAQRLFKISSVISFENSLETDTCIFK